LGWPPPEPPGLDAVAKANRIGFYKRVRTIDECKLALKNQKLVSASLDINDKWSDPPGGRIPDSMDSDVAIGSHMVVLHGYDDSKRTFRFWNSWGKDWGDQGFGYISYETFEGAWWESWKLYPDTDTSRTVSIFDPEARAWAFTDLDRSVLHCFEFVSASDERIAWAFALEREGSVEIEELFVRPQFRRKGYGSKMIRTLHRVAMRNGYALRIWISHADAGSENIKTVEKMSTSLGLNVMPSGNRWAPLVARLASQVVRLP
jgi:GNAT superfamily N-acetyltransferase